MAIAGTFNEPIDKFAGHSTDVHRLMCNDNRNGIDRSIAEVVQSYRYGTDDYNFLPSTAGIAEYPIEGNGYVAYTSLLVLGYTKEQMLEFFFGAKRIKYSWNVDLDVQWNQTTKGDRYPNHYAPNDLLFPNTRVLGGNYAGSVSYSAVEYEKTNGVDWIIPQERVCGVYKNWSIEDKTYLEWSSEFRSFFETPPQDRHYYDYSLYPPILYQFERMGDAGYVLYVPWGISHLYTSWTESTIATSMRFSPYGQGDISRFFDDTWNKHFQIDFTFTDTEAEKDISGKMWVTASEKSEDIETNVQAGELNIEVERFQFQK